MTIRAWRVHRHGERGEALEIDDVEEPAAAEDTASCRRDPVAAKRASGFNLFSRADGERVHTHLVDLLDAGSIRTVVGRSAPWTELPAELARLASRATVGRTVLDWRA